MPSLIRRALSAIARKVRGFRNPEPAAGSGQPLSDQPQGPDQRLRRARRRAENTERELDRVRAGLAEARKAARGAGGEPPPLFFIVGRAKSGTSWLMRLMNAHPEILCRGEGRFFGADSRLSLYGALSRSEEVRDWMSRSFWTRQEGDPDLRQIVRNTASYLLQEKLDKSGKRIVGDKTPFLSLEIVQEIGALFPEAKVIHIVRDGRDVAVSGVHHQWNHSTDVGGIIEITAEQRTKRELYRANPDAFGPDGESLLGEDQAALAARGWRVGVERAIRDGSTLREGNFCQVRYEDLLTEPVVQVRRLLDFLGADSDAEIVQRCVEATVFERASGRSRGEEDPTSFFRKGIAGDWKNYFTGQDRQVFKKEAGDLLIELGYETDYDW